MLTLAGTSPDFPNVDLAMLGGLATLHHMHLFAAVTLSTRL